MGKACNADNTDCVGVLSSSPVTVVNRQYCQLSSLSALSTSAALFSCSGCNMLSIYTLC
eukprot:m.73333 g.73333  ORF g.73333 m.73333 type:complete len:59 (-) comp14326_c1_seq1:964-1140(-)